VSSPLDPDNPVAALVIEGMQAEAAGRPADAARLFDEAWTTRSTSAEAAVAAHYVARHQPTPDDTLAWNQRALDEAGRADPAVVAGWLPSLHLNLGRSWEDLGDVARARAHYVSAQAATPALDEDGYGQVVRGGIASGLARTTGA
jgi:hypothetical protein